MTIRFLARFLSIGVLVMALIGCTTSSGPSTTRSGSGDAEKELRVRSAALQKSILEAALSGAVVGPGFFYRRTVKPSPESLARSAATGAATGIAPGAYVGWVKGKYASQEGRLEQVKTDLDRNSAEVQATINVMRDVLALQNSELAAIRAKAASGTADSAAVASEVAQAQANLNEMQKAINGASRREQELTATRGIVPASAVDPDLQALSSQIASMRAIASDLSESI